MAVATPAAEAQVAAPGEPSPGGQAAAQAPARAAKTLKIRSSSRHIVIGRDVRVAVRGAAGTRAALDVRTGSRWTRVDRGRLDRRGRLALSWQPRRTGSRALRVRQADGSGARKRRVHVYRRAHASWYGPGLYGGHLACGGRLSPGTLGVAHKTLPCGTKVRLRYRGRSVRVPVVDRGPFVGGREFDLTAATKARLGFGGVGTVLSTR